MCDSKVILQVTVEDQWVKKVTISGFYGISIPSCTTVKHRYSCARVTPAPNWKTRINIMKWHPVDVQIWQGCKYNKHLWQRWTCLEFIVDSCYSPCVINLEPAQLIQPIRKRSKSWNGVQPGFAIFQRVLCSTVGERKQQNNGAWCLVMGNCIHHGLMIFFGSKF